MKLMTLSVPAIVLLSFTTGKARVTPPIFAEKTVTTPKTETSPFAQLFEADAEVTDLYNRVVPGAKGLSRDAFVMALRGYHELAKKKQLKNPRVITIIDYTLSSLQKRLFVVDLQKGSVLYNTYVAHGMNSGKEYARKFSNSLQSLESSLGFYVTLETYFGKNGLALRLKGLEKGINDNAVRRGIVLHGAAYVSERYGHQQGFMGRSEGCPAVPSKETGPIIKSIRNGSLVFAFYPSQQYLGKTKLLEAQPATETPRIPLP
jgi:hypothetical protein